MFSIFTICIIKYSKLKTVECQFKQNRSTTCFITCETGSWAQGKLRFNATLWDGMRPYGPFLRFRLSWTVSSKYIFLAEERTSLVGKSQILICNDIGCPWKRNKCFYVYSNHSNYYYYNVTIH